MSAPDALLSTDETSWTSEGRTPEACWQRVDALVAAFAHECDGLRGAREADERAGEMVGESGFAADSLYADVLLDRLYVVAGRAFPGDWEDYDEDDEDQ